MKPQKPRSEKNQNNHDIIRYVDWILLSILAILMIVAIINGYFINNTETEVCKGINPYDHHQYICQWATEQCTPQALEQAKNSYNQTNFIINTQ